MLAVKRLPNASQSSSRNPASAPAGRFNRGIATPIAARRRKNSCKPLPVYRDCGRLTPTELAMTGTTILAIDLGKYKCVACAYDRATAVAAFRTLTTSRAELERLIRTAAPAVVVIEACSLA